MQRILRLMAAGAFGLGLVIAGVWLAILYMPLPASQVVPRVTAALQERLGPDYSVSIDDAELHRSGGGVELRLVDLAVATAGGPVVASVPRAELRLDGMSLLRGEVKIRTVHVTNPKLDMRFDTTMDAASKQSDLPDRVLAAIGDLDRLLGADGAAGSLEEVVVTGATVLVAPRARAPLSLDGVNLRLSRGEGGAIALAASSSRPEDRWTSAVTVSAPTADAARSIDLGLENIDLAPYSAPFAEKAGAPPVKGRISGHLSARIGAEGKLLAGVGRIEGRGLEVTMPGAREPGAPPEVMAVDRAQLALSWDPAKRAVTIEPSQIRGRGGQMAFTGTLVAPPEPGAPWTASIDGRDVLLSGEAAGDPPLRLDRVDVAATFDPTAGVLEIGKAQFLGPTARASLTGLVRFEGASPAVRLGVVADPMPASAVKRLWPFFLVSSIRGWVVENVGAGTVDSLSLTIDVPSGELAKLRPHDPLPPGSMALDIGFSDGVLRGKPGLPWIEAAKGRVLATSRKVDVSIEKAFISNSEADGALAVNDVLFTVPDLAPRHPKARVTLKADGSLKRALTLVGSGAFGPNPLPSQLDVAKVTGRIAADVTVDLELDHAKDAPKPAIKVAAEMRDVRIAGVFAGRNFEKGTLQLKAGDAPTTLSGKGVVGGAPATVSMTDAPAGGEGVVRRKLAVMLTADAADLQRLGLDVPGSLKGEVPLSAELSLDDPKAPMSVSADLSNVGIDGLLPGFKKPAGRPGRVSFMVDRNPDKTVIRDFALESGDRSVRGAIEFGPKGELLSATLPIYRPGPGDDAKVEIDKARGGVTRVAVQGAALDLKPLLDKARGKPSASGAGPQKADADNAPKNLDVTAKLGTGLGYGDEAVAGLDIKLVVRDGKVREADGSGRIGDAPITLATGGDGRLAVKGGDAGAFFRFADLYGRIDGGAFDLDASLSGGPGLLRIRDFAVRNETALDRVRRTTGADEGAAAPPARGATRFDRLQVKFVQSTGRIRVDEATVYGPQLGATLSGDVNYAVDRVDLVGTFVPIYALNNLVSRVPIIGALLGGGKNGGLVGVTFQVKGATTAPTISINPMSAVAPGFFRKIFEFRQGQPVPEAPTGSTAPNATAQ
ncbi:DUF3971 domain-containing protein [Hansschlegelia zhihuaiae]|uniref:YhdP family protein n=1 Tax=Hansschlegelia zhihuaiae TaxID=405005 RepID=UPI001FE04C0F|nr:DUF3971 domain-containing protein [Hansschlegelia zhihuaiae]